MTTRRITLAAFLLLGALGPPAAGQPYGEPDRGQPGDAMIQAYLARVAEELDGRYSEGMASADDWTARRPAFQAEFLHMLGLDPLPERTPLHATVTGTVQGEGFVVENLHYQSVPGLYVTANLYRPADVAADAKLPAVLYVCGHSPMGRDGNKTVYQPHGIWFARHGYVCLVVDTLQMGEIPGIHHGTYREGRWWWHSRGYTSAGVECWNGVRGIDYLLSRPDVDPDRLAVTGISGGGAATFWVAGADDRVAVAVPVSGMADLSSYVGNRVINGHCDCMFLYNAFEWPWTRIAALIAPRPMLFVNSDADAIFPMDANERVIARLERLYSQFGAGDQVDAVVSVGGHAYREDIRRAAYRFLNAHLKGDASPVLDSEADVTPEAGVDRTFTIPTEQLRVFATDDELPGDALNGEIDRHFVPMARVDLPGEGEFDGWRDRLLDELRRVTFGHVPERIPPARVVGEDGEDVIRIETEPGIVLPLSRIQAPASGAPPRRVLLVIADANDPAAEGIDEIVREGDAAYMLPPRGVGPTRWTESDPPNYVARAHVLLGRTIDSGRTWDAAATARYLDQSHGGNVPVAVVGRGAAGILGAYAALLEPEIAEVVAVDPPASHMDEGAPQYLNVLRVLDIPEALGLLAPRPLTIRGGQETLTERVGVLYDRADAAGRLDAR